MDGGFVQVARNVVSVLTQKAVLASKIDEATAREQIATALQKPTNTAEVQEIRDRMLLQARALLRVAQRGKA